MKVVAHELQAQYGGAPLLVHTAISNYGIFKSFFSTSDGIAKGGTRLADEIAGVLKSHPTITTLSIIALSLGGLYSRFAVYVLEERGILARLTLQNFITLATPHLGVQGHFGSFASVTGTAGAESLSFVSRTWLLLCVFADGACVGRLWPHGAGSDTD